MLFRMLTIEWVGVSAVGQRHFFHNLSPASLAQRGRVNVLSRGTYAHAQGDASWVLSVRRRANFLIYLSFEIA